MSIRRLLVALLASGIALCFAATNAAAQVRVLIDASRDGGVWWGPQTGRVDPNLPHQGKPLADFLRAQGLQLTELGSPLTVTCALLTQFDLVVVVDTINVPTWSASEISAYNGFVSSGGRLIYLTDHKFGGVDPLGESFGLRFSGSTGSTTITQFAQHPVTAGVTSLFYAAGSLVTAAPPSATMLGFLAGTPVMGVMPYGAGRVFFLGETNGIQGIQSVPTRLVTNLVTFMLMGAARVSGCGSPQALPGPPTGLSGSASGSTVTLRWTAPSTGGAVSSYVIEAGVSPGDSSLAVLDTGSTLTSFTAFSVPSGTYFIRVRARNSAGTGPASNEVAIVVGGGGGCSAAPNPPLNLAATVNGMAVTLSWSSGGGCPVSTFVVRAGSAPGLSNLAIVNVGGALTLTASAPQGTYYIRVHAQNSSGTSGPSNEIVVRIGAPSRMCEPAAFPRAVQWPASAGGNDHLYEFVDAGRDITWEEALAGSAATGQGWHLATLTSAAENDFVKSLFANNRAAFNCCLSSNASGPWLGAFASTFTSNDWRWVTGEPFAFTDWGPLEPFGNGDRLSYAEFGAARVLAWNDVPSVYVLSPRGYVRECSPSPDF